MVGLQHNIDNIVLKSIDDTVFRHTVAACNSIDILHTVVDCIVLVSKFRQSLTVGPPLISQYCGSRPNMVQNQWDQLSSGPSFHQAENRLRLLSCVLHTQYSKHPLFPCPPTNHSSTSILSKYSNTTHIRNGSYSHDDA